jgi:predicted AAA+ superfamily ATPase
MIETVKSIFLDSQEMALETGVPRRLRIETVPGKATVCIGVRRAGKSTYLFQIMDRLLKEGVSRQNILYANFFDDRLHGLRHRGPGLLVDSYYSLYPGKKGTETVHCFFDEIQAVERWEPFVERLMRISGATLLTLITLGAPGWRRAGLQRRGVQ